MKISVLNSLNNYNKVISDYKYIRNKIVPKNSPVNFKGDNLDIRTQRPSKDISQFIIDAKINNSQKIDNKKQEELIEKYDKNIGLLRNAPILDRFDYVITKLKQGEYISATTMGMLSIMYGPEDLREVKSAYKQIKNLFQNNRYEDDRIYQRAQVPFSFFRGSILANSLNHFATQNLDLENMGPLKRWWYWSIAQLKLWLLEKDKAVVDTKFGEKVLDFFNVKADKIITQVDEIAQNSTKTKQIKAYEFISDNKLGKLTARAMTRIPVLGTIADATIEALEIRNDIKDGENFFESAGKVVARYATSTFTTAYLGAIGSKFGPVGSLGSIVLANYISNKIEKIID